jgi:hypothetical protein
MMGIYSLVLLFLGILIIGLVYAKTGNSRISHHVLFAIILSLFWLFFLLFKRSIKRSDCYSPDSFKTNFLDSRKRIM